MLSNFSQYAPQGLAPQIPGMQAIGPSQLNSAVPGRPGAYGSPWFGHELGQQGVGQQAPPWAGQFNPIVQNPLAQTPFFPVLGQLAQQLTIQCAVTQQIAQQITSAVQHLAHQLAHQSQQGQYYGQNPLAASIQGGYSGFNPQTQGWGVPRPATVQ
jgi:hypothetical protein